MFVFSWDKVISAYVEILLDFHHFYLFMVSLEMSFLALLAFNASLQYIRFFYIFTFLAKERIIHQFCKPLLSLLFASCLSLQSNQCRGLLKLHDCSHFLGGRVTSIRSAVWVRLEMLLFNMVWLSDLLLNGSILTYCPLISQWTTTKKGLF